MGLCGGLVWSGLVVVVVVVVKIMITCIINGVKLIVINISKIVLSNIGIVEVEF